MAIQTFDPPLIYPSTHSLSDVSGRNMTVIVERGGTGDPYTFNIDLVNGLEDKWYGLSQTGSPVEVAEGSPYQLFHIQANPPELVPTHYQNVEASRITYFSGDDKVPSQVHWGETVATGIHNIRVSEGNTATLTLKTIEAASQNIVVALEFIPITADTADIVSIPATVNIPAGQELTYVPIEIVADSDVEYNHSFEVKGSIQSADDEAYWLGTNLIRVTIDENPPDDPTVYGCMDPNANNYNPNATADDGSCTFDPELPYDGCALVGSTWEVEHWFKVFFVEPDNGEQLHDQDLIEYDWWGSYEQIPEVSLYAHQEKERVALFRYAKVLELSDADQPVNYDVTAWARDLRFSTLVIDDEDSETVDFVLPCISEGNKPSFSIADLTVTEPESGTLVAKMIVTASEAVEGLPITIDYCSSDITATSFSSSVEVQHVAYDKNNPPEPFLSYLDYGDVRVVFDASFPKFYNSRYTSPSYANAWGFLTNACNWLNRKGGSRALIIGERDANRSEYNGMPPLSGDSYDIKGTGSSGFYNSLRPHLESIGYTVDVIYSWDFGDNPGYPTTADFELYDVVLYMSSWSMTTDLKPLSSVFVSSLESAVRKRTGLIIVTDHTLNGSSFAVAGNQIAARFFAEFSGSIDRTIGTDFDEVRTTYGDHPLIAGLTGTMPGDSSEGKVETNAQTIDPDYEPACGTLTFNEGDLTKEIEVTINTDQLYEDSETLRMTLSNVSRGTIGDGEGILTIDEWIVPELRVELAAQGAKKQLFVGRDTSGSTDAQEVTINGVTNQRRRELMEKILTDYNLASCQVPVVTGHGSDGCSTIAGSPATYAGVAGASSALTVSYINSVQSQIDADTDELSILVMNDSSDAISHDDTVWQNEWAWIAALGIPVTMTFVRIIGQQHIDADTGNYQAARLWFESVVAAAPANVDAYFKSYSSYTTGADGELNDILSSTINNEYSVICTARPDQVTIVSAPTQAEAEAIAAETVSCP